jgi:hypothetical protein
MKSALFFFFSFLFMGQVIASAPLDTTFMIDGGRSLEMEAGEKTEWRFFYVNPANGMKHKMFMKMHAKPMHMIIIRDDYSHIAHVHPYFDMKEREFSLDLNVNSSPDFDNQNVVGAIPTGGRYLVFTEVMPMGLSNENPMVMNRFEVQVTGSPAPRVQQTYPEGKNGIDLYFDEEGNKSIAGSLYKVTFSYEQFDFCSMWLPKFYFEWFQKDSSGVYKRAKNFERWLEMGAHSILIDNDHQALSDKIFYHLHAFLPISTDGEFVFPYHDHKRELPEGRYKIWGQFKREGKVFTVPVPFTYSRPNDFPLTNKCK